MIFDICMMNGLASRCLINWVTEHMQTIDLDWLDSILAHTANMCLNELKKSETDPVPIKGKESILVHESEDFESGEQDVKKKNLQVQLG